MFNLRPNLAAVALSAAAFMAAPSIFAQDGGPVDAGAAPPDGLVAGETCVVADDQCGAGTVCATVFNGAAAACYNSCDTNGAACTSVTGPGTCTQAVQDGPLFCLTVSPLAGPCGDNANATCDPLVTGLCLTSPGAPVGFCAVICTPADPTTCSQAATFPAGVPGCGCSGTQLCSSNPLTLEGGDGVCAQPNIDGPCGTDPATGEIGVCTNGQNCGGIQTIADQGTCAGEAQPETIDPTPTEPDTPAPTANPTPVEPEGRTEPEPTPDPNATCSSSQVPNTTIPFAFGLVLLLGGVVLRRRR